MDEQERILDRANDRILDVVKAGTAAVTVLNTGSWLALLSQAGKLASPPLQVDLSVPMVAWGFGALFGTAIWLMVYLNEHAIAELQLNPGTRWASPVWWVTLLGGIFFAVMALGLFGWGVLSLAAALG